MNIYTHTLKHFKELTTSELYAIMRLRNEVFVVEQHCIYQDADNKDLFCHHLMLYDQRELVAYARLVPPGLSFVETSIGRVITSLTVRGTGAGRTLMQLAVDYCFQLFGEKNIMICAQLYAKPFYNALGFSETGISYDKDGIEHIDMIRSFR